MSGDERKTLGILGGMGPEATAYFFELVIRLTDAAGRPGSRPRRHPKRSAGPPPDQGHPRGGPEPLALPDRGGAGPRAAGADFAVMPCVTAHYFLPELAARVRIPFVNLLDESRKFLRKEHPGVRKVGLIATTGTVHSGIVSDAFAPRGIEVLIPAEADQARVMEAIYGPKGIKAGFTTGSSRRAVLGVARRLVRNGAPGRHGRMHGDPPGPPGGRPRRALRRTHAHRGAGLRHPGGGPARALPAAGRPSLTLRPESGIKSSTFRKNGGEFFGICSAR